MTIKPVSFKTPRRREPRLSVPYVPGKNSIKHWTPAEDAIIRAHYENDGGLPKCMELLPAHRSAGATQQRAMHLGLSRKGKSQKWLKVAPPDLDDKLRAAWARMNKKKGEVEAVAAELGLPRWWVSKRARKLGLTQAQRKEPPWTAAEDALMKKVPLHDPDRCAKIFREHGFQRTPTAIVVRAKRLDLSRRYTVTFSATRLGRILGLDSKTVTLRCVSGEIKASKRKTRRLAQQGGDPWSITRKDARAFVIEHLELIDFRTVDKFELVDLLIRTEQAEEGQRPDRRKPSTGRPVTKSRGRRDRKTSRKAVRRRKG